MPGRGVPHTSWNACRPVSDHFASVRCLLVLTVRPVARGDPPPPPRELQISPQLQDQLSDANLHLHTLRGLRQLPPTTMVLVVDLEWYEGSSNPQLVTELGVAIFPVHLIGVDDKGGGHQVFRLAAAPNLLEA